MTVLQLPRVTALALCVCAGLFAVACAGGAASHEQDQPAAAGAEGFRVPVGFPALRVPEDNPLTLSKIELGRFLFYDERLSANQTQSCASCHLQEKAFSDGRVTAVGATGEAHPRNSPSLTNVGYNATLTWANPILTEIEQQLLIPIFGETPVELGVGNQGDMVLRRFAEDPEYQQLFAAAFDNVDKVQRPTDVLQQAPSAVDTDEAQGPVTWKHVIDALASFSRALISGNSAFDRFVYADEPNALDASARRGMELFFSERLECHHCHGGFNFTESSVHEGSAFDAARFHNTGLYNIDGKGAYPAHNTGVFEITAEPADMGRFRAPTLRNIEVTAPYMHDGSMATLEEVVRFYEAGGRVITEGAHAGDGRANPFKSGFVSGFTLTDEERADLIHFLMSLTDPEFLSDPRLANPFE